jgi:uncharacterized delta-60 repeat protein
VRFLVTSLIGGLVAITLATSLGVAASSSTVVSATVPSATSIDGSGCREATAPAAVRLGVVLPGSSAVSSADCTVTFGSSNATSQLLLRQADGAGVAFARGAWGARAASFGTAGRSVQDIAGASQEIRDVAVLPDGSVIAAGRMNNGLDWDGLVMKLTPTGSLDPAFGSGAGYVTLDLGSYEGWGNWGGGLDIAPDGDIVVAGMRQIGAPYRGLVARYEPDGDLDPTFAAGAGYLTVNNGDYQDRFADVQVRDDGTIIATGDHHVTAGNGDLSAVALRADGTPLSTWGTGGWAHLAMAGAQAGWKSALADDGGVAIVGADGASTDYLVARLTPAGVVETGFSGDGIQTVNTSLIAASDTAYGVVIDEADRVVVVGTANNGTDGDLTAVRLTTTGGLDASFGTGGIVRVDDGTGESAWAVITTSSGGVLIAGRRNIATTSDMFLVQLREDGSLDPTFDGDGRLSQSMAPGNDWHYGIAHGIDGGVVAGGFGANANFDAVVDSYQGATTPDFAAGVTDWDQGSGTFGACLRAIGGTAAASWTVDANADCTAVDTDPWRPVDADGIGPDALVATGPSTALGNVARLRFGFRAPSNLPPGTYRARLTFETRAP